MAAPVTIYRWLNRRADDAPTIANVDGTTYRAADDQTIGVAAAGRDYAGVIGHVAIALPGDRGSVVVAVTSARNRGTIDDTHDAGIGRSDRFASPTAALLNVDGPSTLTPDLAITVFGTTRAAPAARPRQRASISGSRDRAMRRMRTFAAATLNVPVRRRRPDRAPRAARRRAGSIRSTTLSLRFASTLPFGKRRPLDVYADIYNVLRAPHRDRASRPASPIGIVEWRAARRSSRPSTCSARSAWWRAAGLTF